MRESGGTLLIAVADGVGGGPGGEIAASAAVDELAARFFAATTDRPDRQDRPIEERLTDAIRDANTAVLRAADASGKPQAASTLVAAVVQGGRAVVANLGDSRAYLVRAGVSRQLTEDHSGAIASGITRFVGDPRGVQPDVFVEDLQIGDRLLLCSDGLTRHVDPEEIAQRAAGRDADRAVDDLVALANSRGGEDNITVVLYSAETGGTRSILPRPRSLGIALLAVIVLFVVGGAIATLVSLALQPPTRAASPTPSLSSSPTATPTPSPTPSVSPTPTESPTATP